jgi:hypothetical protein
MQRACAILHCHLWPVWLYHIFPLYLMNGTVFEQSLVNIYVCFDFLYSFCLKHFTFREEFDEVA